MLLTLRRKAVSSGTSRFLGSLSSASSSINQSNQPRLLSARPSPSISSPLSARRRLSSSPTSSPSSSTFTSNITPAITAKVGRNLHLKKNHPLYLVKSIIEQYFKDTYKNEDGRSIFKCFDSFSPKVTVKQNFDELNVPPGHVSRRKTDTFYIDETHVLRTHTSAHQTSLMREGEWAFLVTGDCYRRDEIDERHYPIFHQMEGMRVFEKATKEEVLKDLKSALEGMVKVLFGNVEMRWLDTYFPFTDPSLELEIYFNNKWLEVLGCGVTTQKVLANGGHGDRNGWAFGIGLERIAMVLFDIPDIRLFWSEDPRFISQFSQGQLHGVKFKPFSKYPPTTKDISMWSLPVSEQKSDWTTTVAAPTNTVEGMHNNDFFDIVREVGGDLVETVTVVDQFTHPTTKRLSRCYRIVYRSLDRILSNDEVNVIQEEIRRRVAALPDVQLR